MGAWSPWNWRSGKEDEGTLILLALVASPMGGLSHVGVGSLCSSDGMITVDMLGLPYPLRPKEDIAWVSDFRSIPLGLSSEKQWCLALVSPQPLVCSRWFC